MKTPLLTLLLIFIACFCQAQAPKKINYQGVAQNDRGRVLRNTDISLRFFMYQGAETGRIIFNETHDVTTSSTGAFSLQIGSINPTAFEAIDWGADDHFLEIEIDENGGANSFTSLGIFEMISVPYAFYALEAGSIRSVMLEGAAAGQILRWNDTTLTWEPSDESLETRNLQLSFATASRTLTLEVDGTTQNVDLSSLLDNTDAQALSLSGDTLRLTNGGFVLFTELVADNDSDATNELQTLALSGDTLTLSNAGSVVFPTDGDTDATNEIQTLLFSNDTLTLSSGGQVVFPTDGDTDATNELQTLSLSGNTLTLSDGGSVDFEADGDTDATNELQTLTLSGSTLTLSDGGAVTLPDGADNLGDHTATQNITLSNYWLSNSTADKGIRIDDTGQVGINESTPQATLDINGNLAIGGNEVINSDGEFVGTVPVGAGIPSGMITMWYGTLTEIPPGWALCDGNNGTPNLAGKFVVGYDSNDTDYDNLGDEGGEKEVTLTESQLAGHSHGNRVYSSSENSQSASGTYPAGRNYASSAFRGLRNTTTNRINTNEIVATGGNQPHENRPPFFVLAYIMKL